MRNYLSTATEDSLISPPTDEGVLSAIANTPLVKLTRVLPELRFDLYAKLELLNPSGSTKDRPALNIIRHAMAAGMIREGTVIVESSSGNMGIGLAQACAYYGLRFICVVDPKTTSQNIRLLEAYGAEVDLVATPDENTGEYLHARLARVRSIVEKTENSFWPDQYSNLYNPGAHHRTMHEMVTALGGKVDYLFCATSTCGTIRGCAEYLKKNDMKTRVYAVDAVGSVIFGGKKAKRLIPGHGAALRPELFQEDMAHECIQVTDLDCIEGCRRLAKREAILAGGSSGAVLMAVERVKNEIEHGATCVVIFPDRGERYLDTIYSDKWVEEHFGSVAHLWRSPSEVPECIAVTAI
nr:cysteine synthase [uncultured bacterium]